MDLTGLLLRVAARRPHVLVVAVPGATDVRLALEAALARRGWPVATGPADADVLAVAGSPGPELAAVVAAVWEQVPAPRAQIEASAPADVDEQLDAAAVLLADAAHQRSAPRAPEPLHDGHTPGRQGGRSHAPELWDHREHEDHAGHGEQVDMGDQPGHGDHAQHSPQPEPAVHGSHGSGVEHRGHAENGSHAEPVENGGSGDHRNSDGDGDGDGEQSDHADHIGHGQHSGHEGHAEHGDHGGPEGHSDQGAASGGHGDGGGHHDHHGHGGGTVAGLPMAELGADRDGLTLDRLHVPLGPVLPDWPAGLVVRVTLQGDVIQEASAEVLDAGHAMPFEWPSTVARELDGLARILGVAGWPSAAVQARRLRDAVLAGDLVEAEAAALLRRIRRSRALRWLIRGIPAGSTDVAALLAARLAAVEAALPAVPPPGVADAAPAPQHGGSVPPGEPEYGHNAAVGLAGLAGLLVGAELAAARLIVAAVDPDTDRAEVGTGGGHG
jgi:hypothetical protein